MGAASMQTELQMLRKAVSEQNEAHSMRASAVETQHSAELQMLSKAVSDQIEAHSKRASSVETHHSATHTRLDKLYEIHQKMETELLSKAPRGTGAVVLAATPRNVADMDLREDPRRVLARFFGDGDARGPQGCIQGSTDGPSGGPSNWFVVFRPCSSDAIQKMVFGDGCGKGLNVKGKSAQKGPLSGFVPFLQISNNEHKKLLSTPSKTSRFELFYNSAQARKRALEELTRVRDEMLESANGAQSALDQLQAGSRTMTEDEQAETFGKLLSKMEDPSIVLLDNFEAKWGLDVPERLLHEAYIIRKDISFRPGWETGRHSVPAFSNMNLHALRDSNCGRNSNVMHTVVLQCDAEDAMNPQGLCLAYATESEVHAVVSDFDPFLIGHRGVSFDALPEDQLKIVQWCLRHAENVLDTPGSDPWSSRWLEVLKSEGEKGFHPEFPKYGFGDPASYAIVEKLSAAMSGTGGVRHGAECFNFYFPQELDEEYLIIWDGFAKKPWQYMKELDMRQFLLQRIAENFSFPVNPVWPLRDPGWNDILQALRANPATRDNLITWYPPSSGILETIDRLHRKFPRGFTFQKSDQLGHAEKFGLSAMESADLGMHELKRHQTLQRAKKKMRTFLVMLRLQQSCKKKT